MTRRSRSRVAILILALTAVGCGKSGSPTAPAPVIANVAGTWNGAAKPVDTPPEFSMALSATLTQNGATASGTLSCASFWCIAPTGTITATVTDTTFTAQILFANGGTCGTFKGTVSNGGAKMEGTYVCSSAGFTDSGTWQLTK